MKRGESGAASTNAGYTYIGQFIAHDIVPETTPSRHSRTATRHLNLDSLYGTPRDKAVLFDGYGRFLIRHADDDHPDDLVRDPTGRAVIPDLRNDENTIVAQLHLFFLKLHNLIIDNKWANGADDARRLVTLLFQLLVVEDFLFHILKKNVYRSYFHKHKRWLPIDKLRTPREFSHAAFRFGHSMVRENYTGFGGEPRREEPKELVELFRRSQRLTKDFEIHWPAFFHFAQLRPSQSALHIDTQITKSMAQIPMSNPNMPDPIDIIERNLTAGRDAGLPSGYGYLTGVRSSPKGVKIVQKFGLHALADFGKLESRLEPNHGLDIEDLYLWPYLLLEAEQNRAGATLGVLGSLIVAEVLSSSIEGAQHTIYQDGRYEFEEVLDRMEDLGDKLKEIIDAHDTQTEDGYRRICMCHVITLLTEK